MNIALEAYPKTLRESIAAAERGGDADWELVDKRLPECMKYAQDAEVAIEWARKKGLSHKTDGNVRDLAASIFELYRGNLTRDDRHELRHMKRQDSHKPAKFRAACALWVHGERDKDVEKILEHARSGKDAVMRAHAEELLAQKKGQK